MAGLVARLTHPPSMKYNFVDDPGALLAKYANEPPSVELHVHPTHYRFSNQEGIIPRNHPSIQQFLRSVEQGVILPAATEVFRDSGTRFYEGNLILNIVDFTKNQDDAGAKPDSYRILLQPTDLTLWHDLLYTTDASQGKFSDQLALSMESEILNLTIRSLDLRVPAPQIQKAQQLDGQVARARRSKFSHRISKPKKPVRLHEDVPTQGGSAFEDFMTLLSDSSGQSNSNQFMRLSFIEQLKKRRRPPVPGVPAGAQPAAAAAAAAAAASGLPPNAANAANLPVGPVPVGHPNSRMPANASPRVPNPQQIQQLQQQQLQQQQAQAQAQAQAAQQQQTAAALQQQMRMPQMGPMSSQMAATNQRPQTPSMSQGSPLQSTMMAGQLPQSQMSSPMVRARQMQRAAHMNGMTPAHAQVQQQAHAHAMRNANGMNMRNMPNMPNMNSPQMRQQMTPHQMQQQAAAAAAASQGRPMPQNMPQSMLQQQQQRVMQNQVPYSPNMR